MSNYTLSQRATKIYNTVVDIFDWRQTSDVVTPLSLASRQFNNIEAGATVCIPGAGIGTYVLAAIQAGISPQDIAAVELNPAYYDLGSSIYRRFGVNYVFANFLEWDPQMRFDVVIGNPPFQEVTEKGRKDQASNLWTKFWVKSLKLAKEDGIVSLITPTSWLSPSANLRGSLKYEGKSRLWDVFNSYKTVAQVTGIDSFFKGVGSSFGVVRVDKSGNEGLSFEENYPVELGFLPKGGFDEVLEKVGGESTLESNFHISQDSGSGLRVSVPLTRKVGESSVEILRESELPQSGSKNSKLYLYVKVESELEAQKVKKTILDCEKVLNSYCKWSGFMNIQIFRKIKYA